MQPRKLLAGLVEIKALPTTDRAEGRSELRSRIIVPGGELAVLADGRMAIRHLCCLQFRTGQPRGNHFHKLRREYFYVLAGQVRLHLKHPASGEEAREVIGPGDLVYIGPEIAHAIIPLSDGHGLEFAEEPFDATDVYRYSLTASESVASGN